MVGPDLFRLPICVILQACFRPRIKKPPRASRDGFRHLFEIDTGLIQLPLPFRPKPEESRPLHRQSLAVDAFDNELPTRLPPGPHFLG